jgi:hypothetical protein
MKQEFVGQDAIIAAVPILVEALKAAKGDIQKPVIEFKFAGKMYQSGYTVEDDETTIRYVAGSPNMRHLETFMGTRVLIGPRYGGVQLVTARLNNEKHMALTKLALFTPDPLPPQKFIDQMRFLWNDHTFANSTEKFDHEQEFESWLVGAGPDACVHTAIKSFRAEPMRRES